MRSFVRPASSFLLLCVLLLNPSHPLDAQSAETPRRIGSAEKVQVNLVLIDVVVRDGKGNPMGGLRREDFELLVDRLPVADEEMETFEEVCPALPTGASVVNASSAPPTADESQPARHIVILFDFSHLTLSGRRLALRGTRDFLSKDVHPSDRIMLLAHKGGLRLIQGFTSDARILSSRIDELIPDTAALETEVLEETSKMISIASKPCDPMGGGCSSRRALATVYATEEEARTRRSLRVIEDLMPSLSSLRGRKALVVFSDVLRDEPGLQFMALANATPQMEGIDLKPDLMRLTREANAAGVALYTVHASGLDDPAQTAFGMSGFVNSGAHAANVMNAARSGLDAALSLQTTLATETGGRALQRTNDLSAVLSAARQDLSCHYLIGYRHPGLGDNARHSLIVRLRPGPDGKPRRADVQHRPYYIDYSPGNRRDRLVRSALDIPRMHQTLPVAAEAFALAPTRFGRQLLVKTSIPLQSLSLLPAAGGLEGRVLIRGEVTREGGVECTIESEVPLALPRPDPALPGGGHLVYETSCALPPGSYHLSVAMLDLMTHEIGAIGVPLAVPPLPKPRQPFLSEIHLWAEEPKTILVSSSAEAIGLSNRPTGSQAGALVPQAVRRMAPGQAGVLSLLLCPPVGVSIGTDNPIRVRRTLQGEGGATVAEFRDLIITEPPEPATGCYQLLHQIPRGSLGEGIYTLSVQMLGTALGGPLRAEADIAVE